MDDIVMSFLYLVEEGSRVKFRLLLTSPRPTVEVKTAFDEDFGALLHMQQLSVVEECMGDAQVWEMIRNEYEERKSS
jgi:hypothetical protein